MPSPRRIRLVSLAALSSLIILLLYTHPFSHDFYHRTVEAMDTKAGGTTPQKHTTSSNSIHAANAPPPPDAAPPPIDEHMRADAATLPADRDADGDVDDDDQILAAQLKERLKVAENAAKSSANEKVLKPDTPSEIIGVGNAAGAAKPAAQEVVEEKKAPAAQEPAVHQVIEQKKPAAAAEKPIGKPVDKAKAAPPPKAAAPAAARPPPAHAPAVKLPAAKDPAPAEAPAAPAVPEKPKEETLSPEASAEKTLASILDEAPVVIFSKTYCPYSKRAKALLLDKYHITPAPKVVELDEHPIGSALQDALLKKTGRRTVPNIMVHGVSLGGSDELKALDEARKLIDKFVEVGRKEVKITERL